LEEFISGEEAEGLAFAARRQACMGQMDMRKRLFALVPKLARPANLGDNKGSNGPLEGGGNQRHGTRLVEISCPGCTEFPASKIKKQPKRNCNGVLAIHQKSAKRT